MNTAAKVRQEKERHPERFCQHPRCLWRIKTARGENPCRKHPQVGISEREFVRAFTENKHGELP